MRGLGQLVTNQGPFSSGSGPSGIVASQGPISSGDPLADLPFVGSAFDTSLEQSVSAAIGAPTAQQLAAPSGSPNWVEIGLLVGVLFVGLAIAK